MKKSSQASERKRKVKKDEKKAAKKLHKLRKEIDRVDRKLLEAFAQRMEIVDRIGKFKREHDLPIVQKARGREILRDRKAKAQDLGLNPKFVARIFDLIQAEAIAKQKAGARAKSKSARRSVKK